MFIILEIKDFMAFPHLYEKSWLENKSPFQDYILWNLVGNPIKRFIILAKEHDF